MVTGAQYLSSLFHGFLSICFWKTILPTEILKKHTGKPYNCFIKEIE